MSQDNLDLNQDLWHILCDAETEMETSVSSLTSESTPEDKQNPFKKLTSKINNKFEVSLSESTFTETNENFIKTDEVASSALKKVRPFKKPKNSIQQLFNVTLQNSVTDSEFEKVVESSKLSFSHAKKPVKDYFNVSYDETNISNTLNDTLNRNYESITEEKSIFNKNSVLFKKKLSQNNVSEMCLDESSYNDENLRHWMSDNSDLTDEMHHPSVPSLLSNTPKTNEKLQGGVKGDSSANTIEIPKIWTSKNSDLSNEDMHHSLSVPFVESDTLKTIDKNQEHAKTDLPTNMIDNQRNWMSGNPSREDLHSPVVPTPPLDMPKFNEKLPKEAKSSSPKNAVVLQSWEQKFNEIISNSKKTNSKKYYNSFQKKMTKNQNKNVNKKTSQNENKFKPPKSRKQSSFSTKRLHQFICKKLESRFGIDTLIETEELVLLICDTVNKVIRRKAHQKNLIEKLKNKMASAGLIKTTVDFYEFVIKFLPYSFRVKVVPCIQPVTNTVFPPKDIINPCDQIL